jgi:hypothetical protein
MADDAADPTLSRLEDQLRWYSEKSAYCRRWYMRLRVASLVAAATIPLTSTIGSVPYVTGILGVVIVVIEGIQQLNNFHEHWIQFRTTAENLKHEKYLFLAGAGPYRDAKDARLLLAERVEERISTEEEAWRSDESRPQRAPAPSGSETPASQSGEA